MFQPPLSWLSVKTCLPAGSVTLAVTVVHVCQAPVSGTLTDPVRFVPEEFDRWNPSVTPSRDATSKVTVYVPAVATLTVCKPEPLSGGRPADDRYRLQEPTLFPDLRRRNDSRYPFHWLASDTIANSLAAGIVVLGHYRAGDGRRSAAVRTLGSPSSAATAAKRL